MKHFLKLASIAVACSVAAVASADPRPAPPNFGVMLNDDGDFSFTDADPAQSEMKLRAMIRTLEGTPVQTLVYSVATGSDIMLYPSEAGSVYGWRRVAGEAKKPWDERMPVMRAAVVNRLDAVRIAGEEAKRMGLLFVPTLRMNDAHFVHEPMENVLTGRFWVENHQRLTLGASPMKGYDGYRELFDFSHAEVREHRLAVIREVIGRYADLMDGLQLDFMRHPIFFPADRAAERAHLMTELIAAVRAELDEASARVGRSLALQVRVPPTLRSCRWSGLEVERWMRDRLVDVVIPSPAMTLAQDMPVDEFVAIAKPSGVAVYPAIFDRTQYAWPMTLSPTPRSYAGTVDRDVSAAHARGAALNFGAMGAVGVELYNFNLSPSASTAKVLVALANPRAGDRIYAVTPAYWLDMEDAFENRKQVPAPLKRSEWIEFEMYVGETSSPESPAMWVLRVGLHGVAPTVDVGLDVTLNGVDLSRSLAAAQVTAVTGRPRRPSKLHPPDAQTYVQWQVDPAAIRQGVNRLRIRLRGGEGDATQVVEVQLAAMEQR